MQCPCTERWLKQIPLSQIGVQYGDTTICGSWNQQQAHKSSQTQSSVSGSQTLLAHSSGPCAHPLRQYDKNISHQGGTHSLPALHLTHHLLKWVFPRLVSLLAVHLLGMLNSVADSLARQHLNSEEWRLNPEVVQQIRDHYVMALVDKFAKKEDSATATLPHVGLVHSWGWHTGLGCLSTRFAELLTIYFASNSPLVEVLF